MVACGRRCTLCHKFCGLKIELHHIKFSSEGGPETFENCIALCFECHADMRSYDAKHPKGRKFSEEELAGHRDRWYARVEATGGLEVAVEHAAKDKATYDRFQSLLPFEGSPRYLQHRSVGLPYNVKYLQPMYEYLDSCSDPAFEFLDADLEGAHQRLADAIVSLAEEIGKRGFAEQSPDILYIQPGLKDRDYELYSTIVRQLSQLEVEAYLIHL